MATVERITYWLLDLSSGYQKGVPGTSHLYLFALTPAATVLEDLTIMAEKRMSVAEEACSKFAELGLYLAMNELRCWISEDTLQFAHKMVVFVTYSYWGQRYS